jgi:hypothetical protein
VLPALRLGGRRLPNMGFAGHRVRRKAHPRSLAGAPSARHPRGRGGGGGAMR